MIWLAAVLGAIVGSFLNVVIHRYPREESIVFPPSRCPHCGTHIPEAGVTFFGDPLQAAEEALGEEETERARAEGLAMDKEQIMALVAGGRSTAEGR